jgi:hypothetical protein
MKGVIAKQNGKKERRDGRHQAGKERFGKSNPNLMLEISGPGKLN